MGEKFRQNFRMDWQEKQLNKILRHTGDHRNNTTSGIRDLSCRTCYPVYETTNEQFRNFWEWYQEITSATQFSGNAVTTFENLMLKIYWKGEKLLR